MKRVFLILAAALIMTTGCTSHSVHLISELSEYGAGSLINMGTSTAKAKKLPLEDVIYISNRNIWDQAIAEGWPLRKPGRSVFRYAMEEGTEDFAYYIIDHGADIQYVDAEGENELMYLNQFGYCVQYRKYVEKLVENGCDINAVDLAGHNVLEDAVLESESLPGNNMLEKKIIKLLIEKGALLRPEMMSVLKEQQWVCYAALREISDGLRNSNLSMKAADCVDAVILGDQKLFSEFLKAQEYSEEEKKKIVFYTAAVGTVEQLKQEMSVWNVAFDYIDSAGNNLLMAAAAAGNEEVYFMLVDRVSMNAINDCDETLITMALAGENEAILGDMFENNRFDWNYDTDNREEVGRFQQLVETLSYCKNADYLQMYLETVELGSWAKQVMCWTCIGNGNPYFIDMIEQNERLSSFVDDEDVGKGILRYCTTPDQVRSVLHFLSPEIRKNMGCMLDRILERQFGIVEDPAQIIREFVLAGVNLKEEDSEAGSHLILSAAKAGDTESVETLIKYGADVNVPLSTGQTALMITARGDRTILRILLENGADVNAADNEGNTALRYAVGFYAEDCVRILLEYGADKSIPLPDGRSLYEYAVEKGNEEIIELLK